MTLQAFVDESIGQNGEFVLGGVLASPDSWTAFTKEWERLLPHALRNSRGDFQFKMDEMSELPERMERVPWFYDVLERHALLLLSARINIRELRRAISRISVPGVALDFDKFSSPYYMAFRCLMDMFHGHLDKLESVIPSSEKVDFIFDERTEARAIHAVWDAYIKERPEKTKNRYGACPRFEKDHELLPLQGADLWAWWVRKWYSEGTPEKIGTLEFGFFHGKRKDDLPRLDISFNEDQIAETLKDLIRGLLPKATIYDVNFWRS